MPYVPPSILKVHVEKLNDGPLSVDFELDPAEFELEDPLFTFPGKLKGEVELKMTGKDIRGLGKIALRAVTPCARCLEPVDCPMDVPVDETWLFHDRSAAEHEEPTSDEIMAEYYSGDTLDLAPALREIVMAELPDLVHCKPDCKGLCQGCGANLNVEPCQCAAREAERKRSADKAADDARWKEKLKGLKLDS